MADQTPDEQPSDAPQQTPLAVLEQAIQTFVNAGSERPTLVHNALLVWEEVSFDDEGRPGRRMQYTVPTENFTLSGSLGLLDAAGVYLRRDILDSDHDD